MRKNRNARPIVFEPAPTPLVVVDMSKEQFLALMDDPACSAAAGTFDVWGVAL